MGKPGAFSWHGTLELHVLTDVIKHLLIEGSRTGSRDVATSRTATGKKPSMADLGISGLKRKKEVPHRVPPSSKKGEVVRKTTSRKKIQHNPSVMPGAAALPPSRGLQAEPNKRKRQKLSAGVDFSPFALGRNPDSPSTASDSSLERITARTGRDTRSAGMSMQTDTSSANSVHQVAKTEFRKCKKTMYAVRSDAVANEQHTSDQLSTFRPSIDP